MASHNSKKAARPAAARKPVHPGASHAALNRILIVDDHPVFREGLACLIEQESAWVICGEVGQANEVLKSVANLKPDLILLDLSLPDGSGLNLIHEMHDLEPNTRILVLSMHDEVFYGEQALRAGAHGYITKIEVPDKIHQAISQVLNGGIYASQELLSELELPDRPHLKPFP